MVKLSFNRPIAFDLNYPEIPDSWIFLQFTLIENIANMFTEGAFVLAKQLFEMKCERTSQSTKITFEVLVLVFAIFIRSWEFRNVNA